MASQRANSATEPSSEAAADSWAFYRLPPFYTLQPNPPTRQRQISLWAHVLVQSALRRCGMAHEGINSWEQQQQQSQQGGAGLASPLSSASSSASPSAATRQLPKNKVTGVLPTDKAPYAVLYTVDDDIFGNADINRRLPKASAALVFQASMLLYPNRCISNVPLNAMLSLPGDEAYSNNATGKNAANNNTTTGTGSSDQFGSWLSSVFSRSAAKEKASSPQHQQANQQQQRSATAADHYWLVVFANDGGHVSVMTDHVMPWVMDVAGGLTTANLKKNGVITTFDEMCAENALTYTSPDSNSLLTLSYAPPIKGMPAKLMPTTPGATGSSDPQRLTSGAIANEHVLRLLLHFYQHSVAAVPITRIQLFNLDESERQPYEGIKFGGEGQ